MRIEAALFLILICSVLSGSLGYLIGRFQEQLFVVRVKNNFNIPVEENSKEIH